MIEKAEEKAMVQFLSKFDGQPFLIKFKDNHYMVGEGTPSFTVNFKKAIPISELLNSTSIALGEAYMDGGLDIEGGLYEALDHFLGQMGRQFDRVVSVGMVEHVGRENYPLFIDCANKVLKEGGLYLLHFISALKEHP